MEFYIELKLAGDEFPGSFSNGLTLCGTHAANSLEKFEETENAVKYNDDRDHVLVLNKETKGDALVLSTEFINNSSCDATLEMIASVAIRKIKADRIHRMQSFWSAEGKLKTDSVLDLHLEPSWNGFGSRIEKFGNCGSMPVRKYFPFVVLEDSENSNFLAIELYSPTSWQFEISLNSDKTLNVVGGLADYDFGHWCKTVASGESFTTPRAIVAQGKTLIEACDKLVKAQDLNISPVDNNMDIMFNDYCTTWGNPNLESIKSIADTLKGKGIKYLIIDAGWYGKQNWWQSMGEWEVNDDKFPNGLKEAADYIRECGMIPGLWFELEVVGPFSKYYNCTEHLLKRNGSVLTTGERRFWDMEDPWVIEHLTERVIKQLRDNGFGYIKIDYNETIGIGCDGYESLGEGLRKKIKASQEFIKKLGREVPDIVIENCSSGGHRLEPSMMEIVSQASFSDAHETRSIPIIAANLHRVIHPCQSQIWAVLRRYDDKHRIHYSMVNSFLGRMCLSGDIYDLNDEQWALVDEGIEFYRKAADIIKNGSTVYSESDPKSYQNPQGEQLLIRKLGNRELVIAHRFENSKDIDLGFIDGKKIIAEYGDVSCDFSAKAWIVEAI